MDILLSHGYFLEDDIKEQEIMKPYPPLGILYISSWLKLHKIDCQIFDTTFSSKTAFKDFLVLNKPAIVAFYVNLMTKLNILEIIQFIKSEPTLVNTKIILGGPEVTHSKERFLKYGADFIVIGEGEETVLELVRTIHHKTIDFESLSVVSGISFLDKNNGIYSTQEREKLKDLDQLPIPDREAIDVAAWIRFIREMKIPKIFSNISDARLPGKSHYKTAGTSNKLSRQRNKLLKEEKSIFYLVYLILN